MFEGKGFRTVASVLEGLSSVDLDRLSVEELGEGLVELERLSGRLEAVRLGWLEVFASRGGNHDFGFPSPTAFLKFQCGMSGARAHRTVVRANATKTAPVTVEAWKDDRLSTDQANELFRLSTLIPDQFPGAEPALVETTEHLSVADTRRVLEYWRQAVDGPGALDETLADHERRGVSLSDGFSGLGLLDGELTPVCRETLRTALDALMPPPGAGDQRSPRQRRHDALEDLARFYLDRSDTPTIGGEKPHINIHCDLPALQGIAGGLHETETGQVITISELRRLACDTSVTRIILGPESEILDVGRRTRVIPHALRLAVIARDKHCVWPDGCERLPRWCDVHHVIAWADGGETRLDNLQLLCRYHHTLIHRLEELQGRSGQRRQHPASRRYLRHLPVDPYLLALKPEPIRRE
jgi:hypothetical protein